MFGPPRKIAPAVGIAVKRRYASAEHVAQVEAAMKKAVEKAYAEGITDPDEIKRRMFDARDEVKAASTI